MTSAEEKPIEVFYSYAHRDEALRERLDKHLALLRHNKIISTWSDRKIEAGTKWAEEISHHINSADLILLLVSADFIASDYCYGIEMQRALERERAGEARVIPIILRPVDWHSAPFGSMQALPRDAIPVTSWEDQEEAWFTIASTIRLICEEIRSSANGIPDHSARANDARPASAEYALRLDEVFVKSGLPRVTFVERDEFEALKLALAQPGRGVVIEGPSGVGKTTAIRQALAQLSLDSSQTVSDNIVMLSARNPRDVTQIQSLDEWHDCTVIIDDYHRLAPEQQSRLVDYLKYLADTELYDRKLVLVGIPRTGQSLVDLSYDVATRIDIFRFGKVSDELVLAMIQKGEEALNIGFDRKTEIAMAASGSLNVAQYLCFDICRRNHIFKSQDVPMQVKCDINAATSEVFKELAPKFHEPLRRFAELGGKNDITCLALLEELARCEDGYLSFSSLITRRPKLSDGIRTFIADSWVTSLYQELPEMANFIFFDHRAGAIIAEDPQLSFYLNRINLTRLAEQAGKRLMLPQRKISILYCHLDIEWLEKVQVLLRSNVSDEFIELWSDSRAQTTPRWSEELQRSLEISATVILLVSRDFLESEIAVSQRLPNLLLDAHRHGSRILPMIVAPCLYRGSGLRSFKAHNSPDHPLMTMAPWEQERTLVSFAKAAVAPLESAD
jgi:hypothetical protein